MSTQKGLVFENLFALEASRRGLIVARPDGNHLPYDFIISNNSSKMFRVQIKGTSTPQKSGFSFTTRRGSIRRKRVNYKDEIDVLVGIVERDGDRIFYIIPSEFLSDQSCIRVFPNPNSRAKFEKFRSAWTIFE
jgi:hypothetical protein